jgi:hypothetical protein
MDPNDPNAVPDYDPMFFRPCIFPILGDLGYGTSITVNNGLTQGPFATDLDMSISFLTKDGELITTTGVRETLRPGQIRKIDTRDVLAQLGIERDGSMLGVAHMVPTRFSGQDKVTIDRREIMAHVSASDDFIEFRQEPKGVITGVAYQMGPQNDVRFSKTRTTMLQAPKAIVTPTVDTLFALINVSTSFSYADTATMEYVLIGPTGERIARSSIDVPPWTVRYISVRDLLIENGLLEKFEGSEGLGMVLGLCRNAGLVPLSLTRNLASGAIACDHTLPPMYYFTTWGGQKRIETNAELHRVVFEDALNTEGALTGVPA